MHIVKVLAKDVGKHKVFFEKYSWKNEERHSKQLNLFDHWNNISSNSIRIPLSLSRDLHQSFNSSITKLVVRNACIKCAIGSFPNHLWHRIYISLLTLKFRIEVVRGVLCGYHILKGMGWWRFRVRFRLRCMRMRGCFIHNMDVECIDDNVGIEDIDYSGVKISRSIEVMS